MSLVRTMYFPADDAEEVPATGAPGLGAQAIITLCVLGVFWIGLYPPLVIEWANTASQYLLTIL
ncbi:MAG: hypothetical protein KDE01_32715, partial [Caldilineaceae bacterium]|nr:hypothetical protein [Caldilineaceae bacterium]